MTRNDDIWNDENQFFKKIMAVKEKITKKKNEKGRMRIFDYNISLLMLCKRGIFLFAKKNGSDVITMFSI